MAHYAVRLEGSDCYQRLLERRWLILRRSVVEPVGFFTTRWLEAATPEEAAAKAVERVNQEVSDWAANEPDQPWSIRVDAVWEDPAGFAKYPTGGGGFTFFSPDEDARSQAYEIEAGAFDEAVTGT